MPCGGGLEPSDCIADHWCPPLAGRKEHAGWRAPCPACEANRALSIQVRGGRIVWKSHCDPPCDRDTIGKAISAAVPCCTTATRHPRKPAVNLEQIQALLLDKSVPPNALRIGCLQALGMNMKEIVRELGIPRSTYYDAVRILGQKPRSRSVRKLGQDASANSPNSRTKPQVKGLRNVA